MPRRRPAVAACGEDQCHRGRHEHRTGNQPSDHQLVGSMLARPGRPGAPRTYWLVMRLLIALLVLSTCAACAGAQADPADRPEQVSTMPLTFPDGSTTVLRFDPALRLDHMKLRPYQWGRIGDSMRDFDVTPGAQPARLPGIRLRFGPWHLRIWDYRPGDDHAADALTSRQRQVWRTHLHGTVTAGGFLVLSASPPLVLGKTTSTNWGPRLLFSGAGRSLELLPGRCDPADDRASARRASWCASP